MVDHQGAPEALARRGFFVRVIQAVQATIGATLALIVGSAAIAPSFTRREETWLRAGDLSALPDNEPLAVTLRIGLGRPRPSIAASSTW
jgi:hypothetical protein